MATGHYETLPPSMMANPWSVWSLVYFVVGKCELNVNWLEVGLALFYRQNTGKDHGNLFWKFNSQKFSEHLRVTLVNSQHLRAELVVRILTGMGCAKN